MSYTLTRPGWPRPNIGGYPIPWVAPVENLAEVNEGRRLASVGGAICQVCGLDFDYEERAFAFVPMSDAARSALQPSEPISLVIGEQIVIPLDGAILHGLCARLTKAKCPHVRDRGDLVIIEVPSNDADPIDDDGVIRPSYSSGDCIYVGG